MNMMSPLPPPLNTGPQFTPENLGQLQAARTDMRKLRRAVSVATFDGWTLGIFGALTVLMGLTDPTNLVLGIAMVAAALVELRSVPRLRMLDPAIPKRLAINQLAMGAVLLLYAGWRMVVTLRSGAGELMSLAGTDPQVRQIIEPFDGLMRMVTLAVYCGMMVIAIFGQGGMALYYFSRGRHLQDYLTRTPPWIIAMQQAGVSP